MYAHGLRYIISLWNGMYEFSRICQGYQLHWHCVFCEGRALKHVTNLRNCGGQIEDRERLSLDPIWVHLSCEAREQKDIDK